MKIDIHVHATERSNCSRSSEVELIREAARIGLDALVFTDHNKLVPPEHLVELNREFAPFKVFGGTEIRCEVSGGCEDVLVFGVDDIELQQRDWTYQELHQYVRSRGGYQVLAHPFRYQDFVAPEIEQLPPDGVEIHSGNIPKKNQDKIGHWARKMNCRLFHCSDGHDVDQIGMYYLELKRVPKDEKELAEVFHEGAFQCEVMSDRLVEINRRREEYEQEPN